MLVLHTAAGPAQFSHCAPPHVAYGGRVLFSLRTPFDPVLSITIITSRI